MATFPFCRANRGADAAWAGGGLSRKIAAANTSKDGCARARGGDPAGPGWYFPNGTAGAAILMALMRQDRAMRRRDFLGVFLPSILAWTTDLRAQLASNVRRIGFLRTGQPPRSFIDAFRRGLRELGYIEGQNVVIEYGVVDHAAQLADAAAKLIANKVDVLVTSGSAAVRPAQQASPTTPVVFVGAFDPVAGGMVNSLTHPGGNTTGLTHLQEDLTGRRLQLLKELLPALARTAVVSRSANPMTRVYLNEAEAAAKILGLQLVPIDVRDINDLDQVFGRARDCGAMLMVADEEFTAHRHEIAALALKNRLPTMFGFRGMVEAGGLMAYGPDYADLWRRAASQVHKIFLGANAGDLPIEQPAKFELVINMKTATALGLTMPPALLVAADELIEEPN